MCVLSEVGAALKAWTQILYHVWRTSLRFTGPRSLVNNGCPIVASHFSPILFSRLPLISPSPPSPSPVCVCVSAPSAHLFSIFLSLISLALKTCTSALCQPLWVSPALLFLILFFSLPPSAIKPRRRAGTIQRWQNCTKRWVSTETIKAASEWCSLAWAPPLGAPALKASPRGSLKTPRYKHPRDYITPVINLQGPICQRRDCFFFAFN